MGARSYSVCRIVCICDASGGGVCKRRDPLLIRQSVPRPGFDQQIALQVVVPGYLVNSGPLEPMATSSDPSVIRTLGCERKACLMGWGWR